MNGNEKPAAKRRCADSNVTPGAESITPGSSELTVSAIQRTTRSSRHSKEGKKNSAGVAGETTNQISAGAIERLSRPSRASTKKGEKEQNATTDPTTDVPEGQVTPGSSQFPPLFDEEDTPENLVIGEAADIDEEKDVEAPAAPEEGTGFQVEAELATDVASLEAENQDLKRRLKELEMRQREVQPSPGDAAPLADAVAVDSSAHVENARRDIIEATEPRNLHALFAQPIFGLGLGVACETLTKGVALGIGAMGAEISLGTSNGQLFCRGLPRGIMKVFLVPTVGALYAVFQLLMSFVVLLLPRRWLNRGGEPGEANNTDLAQQHPQRDV